MNGPKDTRKFIQCLCVFVVTGPTVDDTGYETNNTVGNELTRNDDDYLND